MDHRTEISDHFVHAGTGTSLVLAYLGLIPGVIPTLALTVLATAVLVLPFVIVGLAMALIAAPPYLGWRLVGRARQRRRREEPASSRRSLPLPTLHAT